MSVDILMATYNGERHIRSQLLSLQSQTYQKWRLFISDDNSTDNTRAIVDEFSLRDPRIQLVSTNNDGERFGPGRNFINLTKYADSDYIAFCDQDDIWFEKKIELLLKCAEDYFNNSIPCLVYCDAYGYSDKDGVISVDSVSRSHAKNLESFLFFNAGYQGCSMLFNQELCKWVKNYHADYFYMHDCVIALIAHTFGTVRFLDRALMLYRQHSLNVTGNVQYGLKSKIKSVLNTKSFVLSQKHYLERKAFYEAYKDELNDKQRNIFNAYLAYPYSSVLKRLWIIVYYNFSLGGSKLSLIAKTLLRRPIEC